MVAKRKIKKIAQRCMVEEILLAALPEAFPSCDERFKPDRGSAAEFPAARIVKREEEKKQLKEGAIPIEHKL